METWLTNEAVNELATAYGFQIRAILPMRSVVGLLTDQGKYICKRYHYEKKMSYKHLHGIIQVKESLARYGLVRPYRATTNGESIFAWEGEPVTVEQWVQGRHADFRERGERVNAVQAVARLHRLRIPIPSELLPDSTMLHKLAGRMQKASEVVAGGNLIGLSKKEWNYWLDRATRVLRELSDPRWVKFFLEDKNTGVLCHRDLAPHNILIARGSPASLIDFDLAGMDSPVYDLFQLFDHITYRALPPRGWEQELMRAYENISPLNRRQKQALALMQSFPSLLLREIADLHGMKNERAKARMATRIRYVRTLEEERSLAVP